MPENPGKDLALSEPFMQFGQVLAKIGQQVQTGDVPQTVLDAFDYVKSHLQSGGKQVEDAYQTLKKHADKLSEAIVPKLHAEEATPQAAPDITDDELLQAFKNPKADLSVLSPDEQARLVKLTANMQPAPDQNWRQAVGKGQVIFSNKVLAGAVNQAPTIGGIVGGALGGVPGAIVGGAGGSLVKQGVQAATGETTQPVTPLGAAANVVGSGAVQGAAQAAGPLISKGMEHLGAGIMQSALKPGLRTTLAAVKSGEVPPVVRTLLKEGVNVTPGGIEKLNAIITASNDTITEALNGLPTKAGTANAILPSAVAERLGPVMKQFANQVNPEGDLNAIEAVGKEFMRTSGPTLSATEAQALKQGTYKALKDQAYGTVKGSAIEAQKALARGLKEEVAAEAERHGIDITTPNLREGAAITARDAVAKRVAMVGNRDPAGLAWLAHNPTTFLLALAERSPIVKSYLARGLYSAAANAAGVPTAAIRTAIAAVASAGAEDAPQSNVVQVGPYRVEPQ